MINIIPIPQEYNLLSKQVFTLPKESKVYIDDSSMVACENLTKFLTPNYTITQCSKEEANISFIIDANLPNEGYSIDITDKIIISYSTPAGAMYAVDSLCQLILHHSGNIPSYHIYDYPKQKCRSYMIDSSRYFQPIEELYKIVELLVIHRINTLHWHLTDDHGWRVEMDSYPLLHQKGSMRARTNLNHTPHGGYYTKEQIRDFVKYCEDRNISIIPEFDIPGHTQSLLACYPWLGCFDRQLDVATHCGVHHDILCAGKQTTYDFLYKVIDELCELFPSKYFHIGGDEAVKFRWQACPHCQEKMKEQGLKNEEELQAYFTNVMAEYLHSKGKEVIMWNEAHDTQLCDKSIIAMMWNADPEMYSRLDRDGRRYINADSTAYYLDLPYYKSCTLKNVYEYEPNTKTQNKELCIGQEACLWTEFVPDYKKIMKMTIPRLTAFTERNWSNAKDYQTFRAKLPSYYNYLQAQGFYGMKKLSRCDSKFYGLAEKIWFERRQIYWQGAILQLESFKIISKQKKLQQKNQKN